MLYRIVLTLLLVINSKLAFSQFSFGIKGGLNYVNQRVIDTQDKFGAIGKSDWSPTFHVGVYGKHILIHRASILWEALVSNKGYKSSKGNNHLTYLTIPLLFRYMVYKKLSFEAGAEFGVLLFTYYQLSDIGDNDERYGTVDLGLSGGIHYDINDRFGIGFRYTQGIANVLSKDYAVTGYGNGGAFISNYYDNGLRIKNHALQLSVGCRLSKNKKEDK